MGMKKVKVLSSAKKTKKDAKKKEAKDGMSKARKTLEDIGGIQAQREKRKKDLQKALETASEEAAKGMRMEIDSIETELKENEEKLRAARAEEEKFNKDNEDADKEDEFSDMEVDDDDDRDKPKDSIETGEKGIDPADIVEKLMRGVRLSDSAEVTEITKELLRPTQRVTCYKNGFGKPAIVVDCEVPKWTIYRIRKDVLIPEDCPNLMTWRRAGVKNPKTKMKWSVNDISKIQGIAIEVPEGYDGEPEELVRLIQKLSGAKKDKLKKKGKPIPKQPDVQLLIEWKDGMTVQDEAGKSQERFTSWESRSGCRTLWKKHRIADAFLLEVATKREGGYRKAGGRHSSEIRSMSPFDIPRAGSVMRPGEEEETTENETENESTESEETSDDEEENQKKKQKKKNKKKAEEKEKEKEKEKTPVGSDLAYKTSLKTFESKFRALEDIEADAKLTAAQKGEMIEAFDAYWEKKQAK